MTRQTLILALDALKDSQPSAWLHLTTKMAKKLDAAITAIEQELSKPAQEPVAYRHLHMGEHEPDWEYYDAPTGEDCDGCQALYTSPPDQSAEIERLRDQVERLSLDLGLREGK